MTLALSIIANAMIVNYDSMIIIYSFILLVTVIMIVNYNCTLITIVNYNRKTFIVQATDLMNSIKNVGDGLHRAADEERQQQRSPSLQAPNRAGTDPEKLFSRRRRRGRVGSDGVLS